VGLKCSQVFIRISDSWKVGDAATDLGVKGRTAREAIHLEDILHPTERAAS
jgi:hypothetical protein